MNNRLYVNYGCGHEAFENYLNFDASPTLRLEQLPFIGKLINKNGSRFPDSVRYGDIVKGLPIPADYCHGIYCSHILEHLSLNDFRTALLNTRNILRPGGIFRFVLPDLEYLAMQYLTNNTSESAYDFMEQTYLGVIKTPRSFLEVLSDLFGNSKHLWMWDYKSISKELCDVGFLDVRRAYFGDSQDLHFNLLENEARWVNCLGVECRKKE